MQKVKKKKEMFKNIINIYKAIYYILNECVLTNYQLVQDQLKLRFRHFLYYIVYLTKNILNALKDFNVANYNK